MSLVLTSAQLLYRVSKLAAYPTDFYSEELEIKSTTGNVAYSASNKFFTISKYIKDKILLHWYYHWLLDCMIAKFALGYLTEESLKNLRTMWLSRF
jgi:hypothetical protein